MKAMRIHRTGGPEVFQEDDLPTPRPGPGEALIRHEACGVNFLDAYIRGGAYPLRAPLPCIVGGEGAGTVLEIGPGAGDLKQGDRVVYSGQFGAYCEERIVKANRVARIPDGMSAANAAAIFNKAMTTEYLIRRAYPVKRGDTILVHAAAGGVGLVMCQWLKHLGATVIGTVGSEAKAELAARHGCDHVVLYTREDFAKRARELTSGEGVAAVFDSVGKDTFLRSMDALRKRGYLVCFGESSGAAPPVDPHTLHDKGSLFLTRASLLDYTIADEDYRAATRAVFDVIGSGAVKIMLNQTYRLADVANAHRDLEARRTTGSSVLLVG
ncbi:MAG TPA: quinone oxidoreductase [Stellaceae bacterium]|nr:quinone oxidoreductase [Stellaceae bacterium]